jgi:hypothetical protein
VLAKSTSLLSEAVMRSINVQRTTSEVRCSMAAPLSHAAPAQAAASRGKMGVPDNLRGICMESVSHNGWNPQLLVPGL